MACVPRFRMFLLAAALLLMILPAGCKPVTRPGTVDTAPGGAFTLLLPPDFALVPAAGPARAGGTNFSFAEFRNAQTGERIVVGFLPVLGEPEVDSDHADDGALHTAGRRRVARYGPVCSDQLYARRCPL